MTDFAKLFVLKDVGQVLFTLEFDDEDNNPYIIRIRIPDQLGCELRTSFNFEKEEEALETFNNLTEEMIPTLIKPLLSFVEKMK